MCIYVSICVEAIKEYSVWKRIAVENIEEKFPHTHAIANHPLTPYYWDTILKTTNKEVMNMKENDEEYKRRLEGGNDIILSQNINETYFKTMKSNIVDKCLFFSNVRC